MSDDTLDDMQWAARLGLSPAQIPEHRRLVGAMDGQTIPEALRALVHALPERLPMGGGPFGTYTDPDRAASCCLYCGGALTTVHGVTACAERCPDATELLRRSGYQ